MAARAFPEKPDFFISRAGADAAFGAWVAALIAAQGKTYILQDHHFGHRDFIAAMNDGLSGSQRVVALYSDAYFASRYCIAEAEAAIAGDLANKAERLIPLRIAPCAPSGLLKRVVYTDLIRLRAADDATALARAVLDALGFEDPSLADLPAPPSDGVNGAAQIVPDLFSLQAGHLAPRPELMSEIEAAFAGSNSAALTNSNLETQAISGLGGVGKTMLALEYARQHRAEYAGIWWIAAETRPTLLQSLASLHARLEPSAAEETDLYKSARRALEIIENRGDAQPWLLVYDNVEKPGDLDLLTPAANARVLITSRWKDWDGRAGRIDVGLFSEEQAIAFLIDRAKTDDRAGAAALAEALGRLPLALDQAGSLIRSRRASFASCLADVTAVIQRAPRAGASAGQYVIRVKDDDGAEREIPASVFATFEIALDRLAEGDAARGIAATPEARDVMFIASQMAPDAIPRDIIDAALPQGEVAISDALAALAEVSLVEFATTPSGAPAVSIHRLVQRMAAHRLAAADPAHTARDALLATMVSEFPVDAHNHERAPRCADLAPHAAALLDQAAASARGGASAAVLSLHLGVFLRERAAYDAAEARLAAALPLCEHAFGPESPWVSSALHELQQLRQIQGRYGAAGDLLERTLRIDKTAGGETSHEYATTLHELAGLRQAEGRYAEAGPLYDRALAIDERVHGPEHPEVATTLHALAGLRQAEGRYAEAGPLYDRALAIYERIHGPEHPYVATILYELARLRQAEGRYAEAGPLYDRALAIYERVHGPEHPHTAITQRAIAALQALTGRAAEARPRLAAARGVLTAVWGAEHPRMAQIDVEAARIALALGEPAEATRAAEAALALRQAQFADGHPELAESRWVLAQARIASGRRTEARALLDQAIAALAGVVTEEQIWLKGARADRARLGEEEEEEDAPTPPEGPEGGWFTGVRRKLGL